MCWIDSLINYGGQTRPDGYNGYKNTSDYLGITGAIWILLQFNEIIKLYVVICARPLLKF